MSLDSVGRRVGRMSEKKSVLAVGAHADDVEFQIAGRLSLLVKAGFEPHIMTLANATWTATRCQARKLLRYVAKKHIARQLSSVRSIILQLFLT